MGVFVLILVTAFFLSVAIWFTIGSRIQLSEHKAENEFINLFAYFLGCIPIGFVVIFFGIGG